MIENTKFYIVEIEQKLVADISKLKKEGIKINSNIRSILQLF